MDTTKPIEYVDKEQENDEANWLCSFCRMQNPAQAEVCESCGAPRDKALGTYQTDPEPVKPKPEPKPEPQTDHKKKKSYGKWIPLAALLLFSIFVYWYYEPVTREGEITGFEWEQSIAVEEFQRVRESDWNVPSGGSLVSSNREVRSYRKVLDHYETKTKKVAKKVQDGYTVKYKDLGNGQFKEIKTPKYKTVYENKTYREPVYRQEPIYDTKYYYDIDRWKAVDPLKTSGTDHEPTWAETDLPENVQSPKYGDKRQGAKSGKYWAVIKDDKGNEQKVEYSLDEWEKLKEGDKIEYKTRRFSDDPL